MKSIKKFGKKVSYNVNGKQGSWMLVEEGGDSWLYCTDKSMELPQFKSPITYVNRKGMWDLLVHFGADSSDVSGVFNRD